MRPIPHIFLVLFLALALPLSACSTLGLSSDDDAPTEETTTTPDAEQESVIKLYNRAKDALDKKEYAKAAELFDEVERQYPYSEWATKANVMAAYAHYKNLEYESAIPTLKRFIDLHPGHEDISYAYYLLALSYYEQIIDVGRDQRTTEKAEDALKDVIRRFPDTKYARDARLKLDFVQDHLAGKEMEIGRFYLKRQHHQAAINRFKIVIEKYETTTHVPEALHRMVEAYLALGLPDEARRIAAVLGHNYPGSDWYQASYALLKGKNIPELQGPDSTWGKLTDYIGLN